MKNDALIQAIALCAAARIITARNSGFVCLADADDVDVVALLTHHGVAYTDHNYASVRGALLDALDAHNDALS